MKGEIDVNNKKMKASVNSVKGVRSGTETKTSLRKNQANAYNDFYLENEVNSMKERRIVEQEKTFDKRDRKIEQLKVKMNKLAKQEADKYEKTKEYIAKQLATKEKSIKERAERNSARLLREEFLAREHLCEKEIIISIRSMASKIGWFETALELYKSMPVLFEKDK